MGNALSPRVREVVVRFDAGAGEETVSEFCRRVGISRASFYRIRDRAEQHGLTAALVPDSRAPKTPARRYGPFTIAAIKRVRDDLIAEGMDHGPWSIEFRLFQLETTPRPSRATIARILRSEGLSTVSPRKRPRSSLQRFRRAKANELWQIDGMTWLLDGQPVTIYHLIDDHSRLCIAAVACLGGETCQDAIRALQAGFEQWGLPRSVLSDNGAAFNQHRRGRLSETEVWLAAQGIRPISGQIGHPQTQGKVERSHQGLRRWLAAHPASTLDELQTTLDAFQDRYNTARQHQALGLRVTPQTIWNSSEKAGPEPHPIPHDLLLGRHGKQPPRPAQTTVADRRVARNAMISWQGYFIRLGQDMLHQPVHLVHVPDAVEIFDANGELHAIIPWPPARKYTSATQPPLRQVPVIDRRSTAYKLSQK